MTTTTMMRRAALALAVGLTLTLGFLAAGAGPAFADSTCSAPGQPPCDCGFLCLECDYDYLVLLGECSDSSGFPKDCGGSGERPCKITEHIPSCKSNYFEYNGVCNKPDSSGFPSWCGGTNEPACNIALQVLVGKGPCKSGLINDRGVCRALDADGYPTSCGGTGEKPCLLDTQVILGITSCKSNHFEYNGVCNEKDSDGYPAFCGDVNEDACNIILQALVFKGPCKSGLANDRDTCRAIDGDGFPTSCGDADEKPCLLDLQISLGIGSCKPCVVEDFRLGIDANRCRGIQVDQYPSHCGRCDQEACEINILANTFLPACQPGLTDDGGTCRHIGPHGNLLSCEDLGEPSVASTVLPRGTPAGEPVWGFADLHSHPMSNLAFGGMVVWGEPFSTEGIDTAMPHCDFACGIEAKDPFGNSIRPNSFPLPPGVPVHGAFGIGDLFGLARTDSLGHDVTGYPEFEGWPRHPGVTHQQMYYKWLERAWLGGQKLMVAHAVNNEILCAISDQREGFSCSDMPTVDRQIEAIKEMEAFIDAKNGGAGRGWFRIATSSSDARQIIQSGRMAIILGIEVDGLFGCKVGASCTEEDVIRELDRYYDMGVRHVFPVHFFDNEFSGAAIGVDWLNVGNKALTGDYFDAENCSADGIKFELSSVAADPLTLFAKSVTEAVTGASFPVPVYGPGGHCNVRGLSPLGESLVKLMMTRGMIIDIDHMSTRATDRMLEIALATGYPVVSGHSGFVDVYADNPGSLDEERSERRKLRRHVEAIRDLGGMVAPILNQGRSADTVQTGQVPDDCSRSSKSWAQSYLYAVEIMKDSPYHTAVGLGTDFNGGIAQVAPRFGTDACDGDSHPDQGLGVTYPFQAHGVPGTFDMGVTGERSFDYNTVGVAHAGLLPDFIEDLKRVGVTDEQLEPLFRSAEAYVSMWERMESENPFAPRTTLTVTPPANSNGWHNGDVTLELAAEPAPEGWGLAGITYEASGADSIAPTTAPGNAAQVHLSAEGETTFRYQSEDLIGNREAAREARLRIDRTAPVASALASPGPNPGGWNNTPVTVSFTGADALSGLDACDAPVLLDAEGAGLQAAGSCTDLAGNAASPASLGGINIDLTPPVVSGSPDPAANAAGWNNTDVTVTFSATDALSGVASFPPPVSLTVEGAGQSASGEAFDVAGNSAIGSVEGINIDRTPPVVTTSVSPQANPAGWNNTDVIVTFAAADDLSGIGAVDPPVVLAAEGTGLGASGHAIDRAGNTASGSAGGISIDRTAPVVTWTGNSGVYTVDQEVGITCAASDALSGVLSHTCTDVQGPAWTFPLGASTFSARATDVAGNTGAGSAVFTVVVDADSLSVLTTRFVTDGNIANSLNVKLAEYKRALDRPSRLNILTGYRQELEAQIGRVVSADDAAVLMALVNALP